MIHLLRYKMKNDEEIIKNKIMIDSYRKCCLHKDKNVSLKFYLLLFILTIC